MRLFVALNFSTRFRSALAELAGDLARDACSGRPTGKENFHLTLAFLGEQADPQPAAEVLSQLSGPAFTLVSAGLGRFRQRQGELWWLGLEQNDSLTRLQADLAAGLRQAGIAFDEKPFRPHLTLLRRAVFPPELTPARWAARQGLRPMYERIDCLSLMLSRSLDGAPSYTELSRQNLF